jgi:YggT family protein
MSQLLYFISAYIITPYTWVVIIAVIMSWLIAFNVINGYNPIVRTIWDTVTALTEPLLKPIRRRLPNLGGLDLSPLILLLACAFVQIVVIGNLITYVR